MSELSAVELMEFATHFETLCPATALALSETINQMVMFDPPEVTQPSINALIADPEPVLQTTFTYPTLSQDEGSLLFTEADALILSDLVAMGDGANPPSTLEDEQLSLLSMAMATTVQGMGIAFGNALGQPVFPGPSGSTNLVPLTLSAPFLAAGCAVQISIPYHIEGLLDGTLRILFTPDMARSIAPSIAAAVDQAPGGGLNGDEFGGSASFGTHTAPTVSSGMPGAPTGGSVFQPFEPPAGVAETLPRGMDLIMDIPLDVTVELGRVQMLIKDVLELVSGSIVELERVAGEPIDLLVNGQLIAKGEVVIIEDNFGLRLTEIISPADRLHSVGKRR